MSSFASTAGFDILLVEDNPGDVRLLQEAFKETKTPKRLHVARDGASALEFLRAEPLNRWRSNADLVLLDLTLPGETGIEILRRIKSDPALRSIVVLIFTFSLDSAQIVEAYQEGANCCIQKPVDIYELQRIVQAIEDFWLCVARLPGRQQIRTLRAGGC
jgi:CheY-like chemotaxis protein